MTAAWCWRSVTGLADVPQSGCYAVFHDGRLVYIGSSNHLRTRLQQYLSRPGLRPRKPVIHSGARVRSVDTVVAVKVAGSRRLGDWLTREFRLIHRLRPRDNKYRAGHVRRWATTARVAVSA